jgi:hypothetical protein
MRWSVLLEVGVRLAAFLDAGAVRFMILGPEAFDAAISGSILSAESSSEGWLATCSAACLRARAAAARFP